MHLGSSEASVMQHQNMYSHLVRAACRITNTPYFWKLSLNHRKYGKKTDPVLCSCNHKYWKVEQKPSSKFSILALVLQSKFSCICIIGEK